MRTGDGSAIITASGPARATAMLLDSSIVADRKRESLGHHDATLRGFVLAGAPRLS